MHASTRSKLAVHSGVKSSFLAIRGFLSFADADADTADADADTAFLLRAMLDWIPGGGAVSGAAAAAAAAAAAGGGGLRTVGLTT